VIVTLLLFGSWAEALGGSETSLELREGATAAEALGSLTALAGTARLPRPALAVNRRHASPDTVLREGDEVAVIPPVAGG
jgi:molybdopterin converting factor small subunit